ncbi:hypothetical protein LG201_05365 [Methylobacillus gramineus]|uniref:hypothetical protein n=1 Tax=Methylobacillus gramineus TaxID=755169 RepID=UPI001D00046F|nr:hypothetical protein [Methylobacillus gramineus]MCB5184629.1 hypothetical protein [Methylobacillus gramineus]
MNKPAIKTLYIALASSVFIAGCGGEFAYKRGAGTNDLDQARKTCQASGHEGQAFAKCMEDSGWIFQNAADDGEEADPVIKASFKNDYRNNVAVTEEVVPVTSRAGTVAATSAPKKTTNPMDVFIVSSWWKTGRGADALKGDINTCATQLGPEHQPDMSGKTTKATRGLLLCMKELGWKALQARSD